MTTKPHTETMADIRAEIDRLDEELIKLLAQRQRCVERAIKIKSRDRIPARVPERVDKVIDNVRVLARAHHVDPVMVEAMWTEMVEWFIAHEERALNVGKKE
jgi:isochorismate pyruvate lyase